MYGATSGDWKRSHDAWIEAPALPANGYSPPTIGNRASHRLYREQMQQEAISGTRRNDDPPAPRMLRSSGRLVVVCEFSNPAEIAVVSIGRASARDSGNSGQQSNPVFR
jgi:hypothetical protein